MKTRFLFFLAIFCAHTSFAQFCPPNLDFETGGFDNWDCFIGNTSTSLGKNIISLTPSVPTIGRHDIISDPLAKDPYGGFPQLCPYGGKYSLKLGNSGVGQQAEGISYTFQVPSNVDTFSFTYFYAVVFQDPQHLDYQQPRFFVTAYDVVTGDLINCASYDYIATGGIPGFKQSETDASVLYKEWSPVSIQFAGLADRVVRLEFKTADCTLGGHFGYTYVDVSSACSNILATAPYCIETNSVILNAPYGFQSYTWYNEDYTAIIGNQQAVTLSPPPATSGVFHVDIIPYPGYGCRDTAHAIVTPLPVPPLPEADTVYRLCQFQQTRALSAKALSGNDILWYKASAGGLASRLAPSPSTTVTGTFVYYVSQKVLFGCESFRRKVTVIVSPVPTTSFSANLDKQCEKGNQFFFTSQSGSTDSSVYTWRFGDGKSFSSTDSAARNEYAMFGTYNVFLRVQNVTGCFAERNKLVTVFPNPLARFTFPDLICEKERPVVLKDNSAIGGNGSRVTSWWWEISGAVSTLQNPAAFVTANPGKLLVRQLVKSNEGCPSDTVSTFLDVRNRPDAIFGYQSPLCSNETVYLADRSRVKSPAADEYVNKWYWQVDGNLLNNKNPAVALTTGSHHVKLIAESNYGCKSGEADSILYVNAKPRIALNINDSCVFRLIRYAALDSLSTVSKWLWDMGTGLKQNSSVVNRTFAREGYNPLTLIGQTVEGCKDTVIRAFTIYDNKAFAGRDTLVAMNQPVQLNANGGSGLTYNWHPSLGLNDPTIENPVATLAKDQLYLLDAFTKEGCDSHSRIEIKRYAGPDIYIPSAFTPNRDGMNDLFRVIPVGIKSFQFFAVYNRWGEQVYRSTDQKSGWDGRFRGAELPSGTFVVVAQALDYNGKLMAKKTTVRLLR